MKNRKRNNSVDEHMMEFGNLVSHDMECDGPIVVNYIGDYIQTELFNYPQP